MFPNLESKTMFTNHRTSRCGFFVWGRSHSPQPAPLTQGQVMAASAPWSYGAPDSEPANTRLSAGRTGARTFLSAAATKYSSQSESSGTFLPFDAAADKNVRAPAGPVLRGEPWRSHSTGLKGNAAFT